MAKPQARARGDLRYAKPAMSLDSLADRMAQRGLVLGDRERALRYLRHIGYYRLSPYLIPFRENRSEDELRPGTTFDDVLDLYVFDRRLRLLVLDALERIEVAVRAAMTDHMSVTYDDPFWYVHVEHFRRTGDHQRLLRDIRAEADQQLSRRAEPGNLPHSHRSALEHYLVTYGEPELPPSWLTVELLTLGQLEWTFRNLARRSDRSAIAARLALTEPLLASWLRTYVRVRNICAHHGRLWNVGLGVYPRLPRRGDVPWLVRPDAIADDPDRAKRLYPVLVTLQSSLATISPGSSWARRLDSLFQDHPRVPLGAMGIPPSWREDPFWAQRLYD